jgi:CRP-like cAMP-binding protein
MSDRPQRDVRDEIRNRISRELLVRSGIVHDAAPSQVAQLVALARDASYQPGTTIQQQGEQPRRFLVVTDGEVELGPALLAAGEAEDEAEPGASVWSRTAGRGEAVGLVDALLDRPRTRTATAVGSVRGLSVDLPAYLDFLEQNFELTLALLGRLAAGLHEQLLKAVAALAAADVAAHSSAHLTACSSMHMPAASLHQLPLMDAAVAPDEALIGCHIDIETTIGRLLVLRHFRPFAGASVQAQVSLADDARPKHLEDGAPLFRAGDPGDILWAVASGGVALCAAGAASAMPAIHCGPGDLVEHHAALAGGPRRFTASAVGDTVLLGIDREALLDRMDEHFDLTRSLLGFLGAEQERLAQLGVRALRLL